MDDLLSMEDRCHALYEIARAREAEIDELRKFSVVERDVLQSEILAAREADMVNQSRVETLERHVMLLEDEKSKMLEIRMSMSAISASDKACSPIKMPGTVHSHASTQSVEYDDVSSTEPQKEGVTEKDISLDHQDMVAEVAMLRRQLAVARVQLNQASTERSFLRKLEVEDANIIVSDLNTGEISAATKSDSKLSRGKKSLKENCDVIRIVDSDEYASLHRIFPLCL